MVDTRIADTVVALGLMRRWLGILTLAGILWCTILFFGFILFGAAMGRPKPPRLSSEERIRLEREYIRTHAPDALKDYDASIRHRLRQK